MEYILFFAFIAVMIITLWAQFNVKSTFSKYSQVRNSKGYTGADVALMLLQQQGIYDVRVEPVSGSLTDHYDPRAKVIRLSQSVYASQSVAALGVAAHETGHAVQHNKGYVPLDIRSSIFPVVNLGSQLAVPLVFLGVLLTWLAPSLLIVAEIGVVLFALVVLFQLVTLPVEFNASHRAMDMLVEYGYLDNAEAKGARKVLSAAALTYVAAAASSIITLLRLIAIVNGSRRD